MSHVIDSSKDIGFICYESSGPFEAIVPFDATFIGRKSFTIRVDEQKIIGMFYWNIKSFSVDDKAIWITPELCDQPIEFLLNTDIQETFQMVTSSIKTGSHINPLFRNKPYKVHIRPLVSDDTHSYFGYSVKNFPVFFDIQDVIMFDGIQISVKKFGIPTKNTLFRILDKYELKESFGFDSLMLNGLSGFDKLKLDPIYEKLTDILEIMVKENNSTNHSED